MSLDDFSRIIREMGERRERDQRKMLRRMRDELPAAIKSLRQDSDADLLDKLIEFSGGRSDPREMKLREVFQKHIRKEILRRMT